MAFEREKVKSIIFTTELEVTGMVHIPPGGRLTDFLNNLAKPFIPITDADIKTKDGRTYHTDLMQLNKDYIIVIIPEDSIKL
ncbi:MAG: hypothetical protein PHW02_01175 [bacterium]|nr:hypothetical protein [bacterium]